MHIHVCRITGITSIGPREFLCKNNTCPESTYYQVEEKNHTNESGCPRCDIYKDTIVDKEKLRGFCEWLAWRQSYYEQDGH